MSIADQESFGIWVKVIGDEKQIIKSLRTKSEAKMLSSITSKWENTPLTINLHSDCLMQDFLIYTIYNIKRLNTILNFAKDVFF